MVILAVAQADDLPEPVRFTKAGGIVSIVVANDHDAAAWDRILDNRFDLTDVSGYPAVLGTIDGAMLTLAVAGDLARAAEDEALGVAAS